jgi:hypothetical protein
MGPNIKKFEILLLRLIKKSVSVVIILINTFQQKQKVHAMKF